MPFAKGHTIWKGRKHTPESIEKMSMAKKGHKKGMTGKQHSQETKDKMSKTATGKPASAEARRKMSVAKTLDNPTAYSTLHDRIRKLRGTPSKCEVCGTTNKSLLYDWANLDHKDYQNMSNYKRMCRLCHKLYDKEMGV